jgi:NADPH2:quinone reductase
VVGSDAKAAVARAAGAEHVLLRSDDVAAAVKEITGGHGADVVFDPVGGASFEASTKCVAFEGRIVVVGFASGQIPPVRANHALVKNYSVVGLHWGLYAQRDPALVDTAHAELVRLAADGVIRPVVADVVPFDKAPEAVELLATGATTGRLVVQVAS